MKDQPNTENRGQPMHRFWVKLEDDIFTDLRFMRMPAAVLGIYLRLVMLANDDGHPGVIAYDLDTIAGVLPDDRLTFDRAVEDLEQASLIFVEPDRLTIANPRHYQGKGLNPSDAPEYRAATQQRYRERRKQTDSVTERDGNALPTRTEHSREEHSKSEADTEETKVIPGKGVSAGGEPDARDDAYDCIADFEAFIASDQLRESGTVRSHVPATPVADLRDEDITL